MDYEKEKRIRCFIAVLLDDATHAACVESIKQLKRQNASNTIRWTKPENLHLTLHFLGYIPEPLAYQLADSLQPRLQTIEPFLVTLRPLYFFPPKKPHTIVVPVDISETFHQLHQCIAKVLIEHQIQVEKRAFSPHITLGRFKKRPKIELEEPSTQLPQTFTVKHLVFMQSQPTPSGSHYTPIKTYSLGRNSE